MTVTAYRLVADIGGTNARFALVAVDGHEPSHELTLPCAAFEDLSAAIRRYLSDVQVGPVTQAVIAVATPLTGDQVSFTNNHWSFSIEQTRRDRGLEVLRLINDFTALALALPHLGAAETRQVGGGVAIADAPRALLGAGTGLGVSGLLPSASGWIPIQGEGGHVALAPMNPRESEVLRVLWHQYAHMSAERLVSGPGIVLLHRTLATMDGEDPGPDTSEKIAAAALGGDRRCAATLDQFCELLGTVAANLCVTLGARGGVFIGGGIVPALGEWFDRSGFRARFEHKGRFRDYVRAVPTRVITARNPALRGAARAFPRP